MVVGWFFITPTSFRLGSLSPFSQGFIIKMEDKITKKLMKGYAIKEADPVKEAWNAVNKMLSDREDIYIVTPEHYNTILKTITAVQRQRDNLIKQRDRWREKFEELKASNTTKTNSEENGTKNKR